MPIKLKGVKCPSCGTALEGKVADRVYLCDCGVMHTRDDKEVRQVKYTIALPRDPNAPPSAVIYIPFWRLDSDVMIHYTKSEGGFFNKLFGKDWKGGRVSIYVPALDWDPSTFKHWASTITSKPPNIHVGKDFGPFEREPVTMDEEEAKQMADFLILTFEAEKPGVLQQISYEVKVFDMALLYLPFDRSGKTFTPMV
ncbi:MAG: hypothetical protein JSW25_10450 [Thermoplasmata archaeon]|nr:MAG: hypothetical protein JSW25_10450 [Thermoplasmata archaeon]